MKTLKEFYEEVLNPMDDVSSWEIIVEQYIKSHDEKEFRDYIFNCTKKSNTIINEFDKERFYAVAFNIWKNKINLLDDATIKEWIDAKEVEDDFISLKKILQSAQDIYTIEQLRIILTNPSAMRYFSRYLNGDLNKVLVNTRFVKKELESLQYAFFINLEQRDLYRFLRELMEECWKENLDYTFSFVETKCDIMVTFYVSENEIDTYYDILNRVRKENNEIFPKTIRTSPLVGTLKEWLGFGSASPFMEKDYLEIHYRIILDAFDKTMYDYVSHHMEKLISYKAKRMTIREYLCTFVANYQTEKLVEKKRQELNQEYPITFQEEERIKEYIKIKLLENFDQIFTMKVVASAKTIVHVSFEDGQVIEISIDDFRFAIRKLFSMLLSKEIDLLNSVKRKIHNECGYFDIDPEKFCFDKMTYEKIHYKRKEDGVVVAKVNEMQQVAKMLEEIEDLQTNSKEFTEDVRKKIATNLKSVHQIFKDNIKEE